ncbi:Predicted histone tail methylase containing SET domain [Phaffia rhodozyma]|uniref:Predicted histone tail methylase containing SET domain n=1 Tax=Phaffia rhodozyma TaxID=264483 RepID=A0A0F7SUQ5_PHARH|nr:Predicted histone tail methylase containing SET domain [Phaffia rhodozyma]
MITSIRVPTTIPPHPLFNVEPIAGKELGAVANKPIKKGDLVISERPLFLFDAPFSAFLFSRSADLDPEENSSFSALDRHIGRAIDQLMEFKSAQDKQCLMDLANTHPELPSTYGVFKTNAVCTRLSQGGLFPHLSRVNSSCRPNLSRPQWDRSRGLIETWALRDIELGEELGWMYLDNSFRTSEERQEETLRVLGFKCGCPGCTLCPLERGLSDDRVLRLRELSQMLPSPPLSSSSSSSSTSAGPLDDSEEVNGSIGRETYDQIQTIKQMLPLASMEGMYDLVNELNERLRVLSLTWGGPRGMGRLEWVGEVFGDLGSELTGSNGGLSCRCCI